MPAILRIEKRKKRSAAVFLDEVWYFEGKEHGPDDPLILDAVLADECGLAAGRFLTEEDIEELKARSDRKIAREKALRLLTRRDYAGKELARKLAENVSDAAAFETAERMRDLGLVRDGPYAERLAANLMLCKDFAPRAALRELLNRGLDEETARAAVEGVDIDPAEQIRRRVRKKHPLFDRDEKARNRMTADLLRRGFTHAEIRRALADFSGESDD